MNTVNLLHYTETKSLFNQIDYSQTKGILKTDDFKSEKEFVDYIEVNIKAFVITCLNLTYKSHKREFAIEPFKFNIYRGQKKVDLFIVTECGKRIMIECKMPKQGIYENTQGLGQLLQYATIHKFLGYHVDQLILLTTRFDHFLCETIKDYNLPVLYLSMDRSKCFFSSIEHIYSNKTEINAI